MADSAFVRSELTVPSVDGSSFLHVVIWVPAQQKPHACVQLVHGMAEHIGRYHDFAAYLASQGYVVFGHDHIGHGHSAASEDELGCLPLHRGKDILVEDVHEVRLALWNYYRSLPLFLFGHSMGSYVARLYCARYAEGLSGVILCGTGQQAALLSRLGNVLARILGTVRGVSYQSPLLHRLVVGAFSAAIKDARTPEDWISTDPAVVDAYRADPLSGVMFSAGGYAALTDLTAEAVSMNTARETPTTLPILFIAGEEDPVGNCGKDVIKAAGQYRQAGIETVTTILYPGMRHEILNEPSHTTVYRDVLDWMELKALRA